MVGGHGLKVEKTNQEWKNETIQRKPGNWVAGSGPKLRRNLLENRFGIGPSLTNWNAEDGIAVAGQ